MTEFFSEYGLFLAKTVTFVVALLVIISAIASAAMKGRGRDEKLEIRPLNERFENMKLAIQQQVMDKKSFKQAQKALKKEHKEKEKSVTESDRKRLFVLDFDGDIKATGVGSLREEITALLSFADKDDEVLVRLDNSGGLVHEHGLAASQLKRIRDHEIPLTVAVDKVAASGGYMMACIADKIIAAPFAILGSIGVLAQVPNFHRLLNRHGVDFEQFKAGQYKRTVTIFGENTEEDRAKMQEELEETHVLFKDFVAEHRPSLDMEQVATGEHWYGRQALERKLIDAIQTSDDYLLEQSKDRDIYQLKYEAKKPISEKLAAFMGDASEKILHTLWRQGENARRGQ